eukprot:TRINITY_DN21123_c0_g1_i1.p1 TRINITY_DN21123_c0_g1~~TRINITY_DN21123_c0_g1_i1.p1  ORF type:complete len:452 (-),score=155.15 TRINITY_DN21123_c0_g1_i1:25-1344(-)
MDLSKKLEQADPVLQDMISREYDRQKAGLEMIASENFTSQAVLDCLGSCLTNKYAEGQIGKRYYGGTHIIDEIEGLCKSRALEAFGVSPEEWGVNVQPYSGSTANFGVFTGVISPGDRLIGLDLPSGGHLSHGFQTEKRKVSATSIYFDTKPYHVNEEGYINYDEIDELATSFKPKLIICGGSAYPRDWDYARLRAAADACGALLMADIAHVSGLVASKLQRSPFEHCDIVTSTTHKTLRGPRAGIIFFRKSLEEQINLAVFPGCQGGPHVNQIAGVATALHQVNTDEFRAYAQQVISNAQRLASDLSSFGYTLQSGGTDNHIVLWDLKPQGITGSKYELVLETVGISANKNAVLGDKSMWTPGGIRLGSSPLTTRGLKEDDFSTVAGFLKRAVEITQALQEKHGKKLVDLRAAVDTDESVLALKAEVTAFAAKFPMPC